MRFPLRALLLLILVGPASALAARYDIEGGRSHTGQASTTPAVFLERTGATRPLGGEGFDWTTDVSVGWIQGRPESSDRISSLSLHPDVGLLAAGVRFQYALTGSRESALFFSFQPALTTGRTASLSSVYEFVSTLGWQGSRLGLMLRHVSNGGLHEPNRGETMFLVGVRF